MKRFLTTIFILSSFFLPVGFLSDGSLNAEDDTDSFDNSCKRYLSMAVGSVDPQNRLYAIRRLKECPTTQELKQYLLSAIFMEEEPARTLALESLSSHVTRDAFPYLLKLYYQSTPASLREEKAIRYLSLLALPADKDRLLRIFKGAIFSERKENVLSGLYGISMLDAKEEWSNIAPFLDSPDPDIASGAVAAASRMRYAKAFDTVATLLKSDSPEVRKAASDYFFHLPGVTPLEFLVRSRFKNEQSDDRLIKALEQRLREFESPDSEHRYLWIASDRSAIRKDPQEMSPTVAVVDAGTILYQKLKAGDLEYRINADTSAGKERQGRWIPVRTASGFSGWVHESTLIFTRLVQSVPPEE